MMENATESVRQNAGYMILQTEKIGKLEIVLGENPNAPAPYVTWMCRNGTDYFWGHYFSSLLSASRDYMKRINEERSDLRGTGFVPSPAASKKEKEPER
jgi:hypothetical protein